MAEEKKVATSEAKAEAPKTPETVPYEQYEGLYKQALELEGRYRRLLDAYNALLELHLSGK